MQTHASGCLICGAALRYLERAEPHRCALCDAQADADATCEAGHFVCDRCHALGAVELIEAVCKVAQGDDPLGNAMGLMGRPQVHLHGHEHHFLVPAALLCAACNASGRADEKARLLAEARRRAEAVKGGFCGFWGACGAAVGVGIFVSLLTGATPLSTSQWRLSNLATARALERIALSGGPRCCKRDSFIAIDSAVGFAAQSLGVRLAQGKASCRFSEANRECLREGCAFFTARSD